MVKPGQHIVKYDQIISNLVKRAMKSHEIPLIAEDAERLELEKAASQGDGYWGGNHSHGGTPGTNNLKWWFIAS